MSTVKYLIKAGANVNLQVGDLWTRLSPLKVVAHKATAAAPQVVNAEDYVEIVDALLLAGADERLGSFSLGGMAEDFRREIRMGGGSNDAAKDVLKKLLFCPISRLHKLPFLIRGTKRNGWPTPEEDKRRTRSAWKTEEITWLLYKDGAPEDVFHNVMSFIVPKPG